MSLTFEQKQKKILLSKSCFSVPQIVITTHTQHMLSSTAKFLELHVSCLKP